MTIDIPLQPLYTYTIIYSIRRYLGCQDPSALAMTIEGSMWHHIEHVLACGITANSSEMTLRSFHHMEQCRSAPFCSTSYLISSLALHHIVSHKSKNSISSQVIPCDTFTTFYETLLHEICCQRGYSRHTVCQRRRAGFPELGAPESIWD